MTNLSPVLISALINQYGVDASAAAGAVNRISSFAALPGQSVMSGLLTLTAQNLSGKDYRRINSWLIWGIIFAECIAGCIFALCQIVPGRLLCFFTSEAKVLALGIPYLRIFAVSFLIENLMFCHFGVLTGAGRTCITMLCSAISAIVIHYFCAYLFSCYTPLGFVGIAVAYVIASIFSVILSGLYLVQGRWKN